MKKLKSNLFWILGAFVILIVSVAACIAAASINPVIETKAADSSSASEATMRLSSSEDGHSMSSITLTRGTSDDGELKQSYFLIGAPTGATESLIGIDMAGGTSDGVTLCDVDQKDEVFQITLMIEPYSKSYKSSSSSILIWAKNSADQKVDEAAAITIAVVFNNPSLTLADQIKSIIDTQGVLVSIFTICAMVLVKTGLNVFRFGVKYKSNFVTVEDNDKFKEEMREESRATKADMQDSILKICLREIARDTKPVAEMQQLAQDLKTSKEMNDLQLKNMQAKYNEIQTLSSSLQNLEKTVRAIQYGETTTGERRSGK